MLDDEKLRKFSLLVCSLILLLVYVLSSGFAIDGIGRYEIKDLRYIETIPVLMYFSSIIGYFFLIMGWLILYLVINNVLKSFLINGKFNKDNIEFNNEINRKLVWKLNMALYFLLIFWVLKILYLISTVISF